MSVLVRKIARGQWPGIIPEEVKDIPADTIRHALPTKGNTLSFWEVPEDEIDNAVLAIAAGFAHIEGFQIIALPYIAVRDAGLQIRETAGQTLAIDLVDTHRDMVNLTYESLGLLHELALNCLRADPLQQYTEGDIRRLMRTAATAGRLDLEQLPPDVRRRIDA